MPRKSRIDAAGALHHIMVRGIEGGVVFRSDKDRDHFLERLGGILKDTTTPCYAWALIPNHFHLLLRTGAVPISTVMRRLLTGYALWFNRTHGRSGHLFQNHFKSILCQEEVYASLEENLDGLGRGPRGFSVPPVAKTGTINSLCERLGYPRPEDCRGKGFLFDQNLIT